MHGAVGGGDHSTDQINCGALTGSVGPDESKYLARFYVEIEVVHSLDAAEVFGQLTNFKHREPLVCV